jgi:hypothetical protein
MTDAASSQSGAGSVLMRSSAAVLWLGALVAALAVVATTAGLFGSGGGGGRAFTTVRGGSADLYGIGLYELDTVFSGAGQRGTDLVTLALGVPLLIVCLVFYRRGSLRAGLLLVGAFAYFLYVYSSLALGYAFNSLFLVYVAVFAASLYGLILLLRSIDLTALPADTLAGLPRRGPAAFMFVSAAVVLVVWLQPVAAALASGDAPARMDSYTTAMTYALDLAVIAPALFISGGLLLRRRPLGYLVGFPLLGIILLLGPAIAVQTISQARAGIEFSAGEAIGPVVGFLLVCAWAVWVVVSVLRGLPRRTEEVRPAPVGHTVENPVVGRVEQ